MAITGTKAFTSGEVLTASDVNQYLMRGVKVFSSTAVRDAAYGGAGEPTLEEGETCYITATDKVQTYNGSSWVDIGPTTQVGKVLQVVSTVKTDTFSTSNLTFTNVTGLSVAITPSSASNKVLILVSVGLGDQAGVAWRLTGGNTASYIGDTAGSRVRGVGGQYDNVQNGPVNFSGVYLDSPATTSATTYQVQIISLNTGNTAYVNRSHTDTDSAIFVRGASTITALEISV